MGPLFRRLLGLRPKATPSPTSPEPPVADPDPPVAPGDASRVLTSDVQGPPTGAPAWAISTAQVPTPPARRPPIERPSVFDPALIGPNPATVMRPGEPRFADAQLGERWRLARRRALDHVLRAIAASPWTEELVLRGSVLLQAWYGSPAREPGDIDLVVRPSSIAHDGPWAAELFAGLPKRVAEGFLPGEVEFLPRKFTLTDIWTYDRAPGRRMIFPWQEPGTPPGEIQVDIVFGEPLWTEPMLTRLETLEGDVVELLAAGPEQSLAWKLQWLDSDGAPQGKDLYDAVLLAESTRLPYPLLLKALDWDRLGRSPSSPDFIRDWDVDWDNFLLEYPQVEGTVEDWIERLVRALGPTFP